MTPSYPIHTAVEIAPVLPLETSVTTPPTSAETQPQLNSTTSTVLSPPSGHETLKTLCFGLANCRSVRNKASYLKDYILSNDLDCLAMT